MDGLSASDPEKLRLDYIITLNTLRDSLEPHEEHAFRPTDDALVYAAPLPASPRVEDCDEDDPFSHMFAPDVGRLLVASVFNDPEKEGAKIYLARLMFLDEEHGKTVQPDIIEAYGTNFSDKDLRGHDLRNSSLIRIAVAEAALGDSFDFLEASAWVHSVAVGKAERKREKALQKADFNDLMKEIKRALRGKGKSEPPAQAA